MERPGDNEHRERMAARLDAALAVLQQEVASLVGGDDWRHYLGFQAKLHTYSANNVMLIVAQHAAAFAEGRVSALEPTWVAGFNTWKTLGRRVNKGQRAYAVLAPVQRVRRSAIDGAGDARALRGGDVLRPEETEQRRPVVRGFKVEYVFDVSQTVGSDLPVPAGPRLLEGEAPPGLEAAVSRLIEDRGFSLEAVPDAEALGGANGQTRWDTRTVAVRADMDDAAQVKTLIHEAAHVLLHEGPPGRYLARGVKEVEAESVAFVVASVHGMATGDYSFPYVASWAGKGAARAVADTQSRVAQAAKAIISVSPGEHVQHGATNGVGATVAAGKKRERAVAAQLRTAHPASGVDPYVAVGGGGPEMR